MTVCSILFYSGLFQKFLNTVSITLVTVCIFVFLYLFAVLTACGHIVLAPAVFQVKPTLHYDYKLF